MIEEYKDRLQAAMKSAEVSIPALADGIGLSYQAVRQVLNGDTNAFTAANNTLAARFLRVSSDWLATGEGTPSNQPTSWPFKRISIERVLVLPIDEMAFIEAKLDTEIEAAEERLAAAKNSRTANAA